MVHKNQPVNIGSREAKVIFYVDYKSRVPIYLQVVQCITELALGGALEPNAQLPSVRQLSVQLGINPNTVQKAYTMLESRGVIYTLSGRGNFIAQDISAVLVQKCEDLLAELEQLAGKLKGMGVSEQRCAAVLTATFAREENIPATAKAEQAQTKQAKKGENK